MLSMLYEKPKKAPIAKELLEALKRKIILFIGVFTFPIGINDRL